MSNLKFSLHAKERALERMLGYTGEHDKNMLKDIEVLVRANMVQHPINGMFMLPDWNLVLVIKDDVVVTIKEPAQNFFDYSKMKNIQKDNR